MKKTMIYSIALLTASLAFMASSFKANINSVPLQEEVKADFPDDVSEIFKTSCFDCHSDEASNLKAKTKLNFSKWSDLSDSKKIGKMENIDEVLKKDDMPPGKYLAKYPDHALSKEQKELVIKWIAEESAKLMGE